MEALQMIEENGRRLAALHAPFDPITGLGSVGRRFEAVIGSERLWLPEAMKDHELVRRLAGETPLSADDEDALERLRILHDFPYWAARHVAIKRKGGGDDCRLVLTYPQRKFVARLEAMRVAGRPIRLVLLKARQWGGSTVSQLYMAWLQLVHCTGLNSLIIAHQGCASDEILDMFERMAACYPRRLLYEPGAEFDPGEKMMARVGKSGSTWRVPQRRCKIKIGTAERPDGCRGGDYNLVHLSEVGMWRGTRCKKAEDIVRAACGGVLFKPYTMIVYESTANGVGNFFHREYEAAREGRSQFESVFVAWHEIEQNELEFAGDAERLAFAQWLIDHREAMSAASSREEPGRYLWSLWQRGATLEGINWYVVERAKHSSHGSMAAECPSDATEAFVNSGANVFDKYLVEELRPGCRPPLEVGEVYSLAAHKGEQALEQLRFKADGQGQLWVWAHPEAGMEGRYVAVVDIGGRSHRADWSVIAVLDRKPMAEGRGPEVAAQWYGHIDMDLLAWKAAQIAAYYDNALLVIESNTLETSDSQRYVDGDQSPFILNELAAVYPNLYARSQSPADVSQGRPRKYGFHTNVATKPMIIATLVEAVRERLYDERDARCLDEMLVYERKANGSFGAIDGAHDDLLMTRAIGLHISLKEMDPPAPAPAPSQTQPSLGKSPWF